MHAASGVRCSRYRIEKWRCQKSVECNEEISRIRKTVPEEDNAFELLRKSAGRRCERKKYNCNQVLGPPPKRHVDSNLLELASINSSGYFSYVLFDCTFW